eukprot:UN32653
MKKLNNLYEMQPELKNVKTLKVGHNDKFLQIFSKVKNIKHLKLYSIRRFGTAQELDLGLFKNLSSLKVEDCNVRVLKYEKVRLDCLFIDASFIEGNTEVVKFFIKNGLKTIGSGAYNDRHLGISNIFCEMEKNTSTFIFNSLYLSDSEYKMIKYR